MSDSYGSLKPLWTGMSEDYILHYLADLTFPFPSHCAVIIFFKSVPVYQLSWLAL